jgi:hypothetical protein
MDKKKHVGDVLGISRSTARAPIARSSKTGGRKAEGRRSASAAAAEAGVVGGVRGRGR